MRVTVILNQQAGAEVRANADFTPGQLSEAFSKVGLAAHVRVVPPEVLVDTVRTVVAERAEAIVVGGGDGTIGAAAGVMADTHIPLGILPLGTLNHFAKDLKIPADWRAAVTTISEQTIQAVDLAEVNGRIFINNCSLGAYPEAVRRREALRLLRGLKKWTAMAIASLQVMRRLRRLRVTIEHHGQTYARRTPFVLVANNRYSGNLFSRSLRERIDEGELWVYTTPVHRVFPLLRMILQSFAHRLEEASDLESWAAQEILLSTPHGPLPVALDGEIVKVNEPLRFQIRPRALRVFVPGAGA